MGWEFPPCTRLATISSLDVRSRVSQLLNSRLASAIDLYLQTKHAHWNVKGPSFIALHELFDKLGEELEEHIDDIAERAVALGAVAEGTTNVVDRAYAAREVSGADQRRSRACRCARERLCGVRQVGA